MRVLLRRRNDGVGDWLFMLACIKHYNRQRIDVDFYVDFEVPARADVESPLPPIIRELYEQSDVTWYIHELAPADYDVVIPHVVYKLRDERTYVESMLAQLITATGRDATYDPELVPRFVYPELGRGVDLGDYVVIATHGKISTAWKDWPRSHFEELGATLKGDGFDIVQLGRHGDRLLEAASGAFFDCNLDTVAGVLARARLYIGLEDGLSVLASWLGVPTIVMYQGGPPSRSRERAARWSGPVAAKVIHPAVADVLVEARKVLRC